MKRYIYAFSVGPGIGKPFVIREYTVRKKAEEARHVFKSARYECGPIVRLPR